MTEPTTDQLRTAAALWLEAGWHPIPLTGADGKAPARKGLTGRAGIDLEADDIPKAFRGKRVTGLGIRMPIGVLGIDLDNYGGKTGTASIEALCEELSVTLPRAPSTSGRIDGSEIRFYRVPPEVTEWTAEAIEAHGGGVDLIHRGWRHAKAWPSVHHVTGLTYGRTDVQAGQVTSHDDDGEPWLLPQPDELPDLPGALVAALTGRDDADERSAIDWTNEHGWAEEWSPAVTRAWERWEHRGSDRYQAMVPAQAALVRLDSLGQAGATSALDRLRSTYVDAVGDERDAAEEFHRALAGAVSRIASTTSSAEADTDLVDQVLVQPLLAKGGTLGTDVMHTPAESTNLPESFWTARPALEHIRQAAWSRRRSPDAVLGAVLARLSAITPPLFGIPATVGAPSTLSTYVALVGPSGTGKSSAVHLARELVDMPTARLGKVIEHGLGSGEGLIELYIGEVETGETKANGQPETARQQKYDGAIVMLDEGAAMAQMGGRTGSTMLAHLRSMWTGAPVGQANASKDTTRKLSAGGYALGFVVGIQPQLAADLLSDTAAGTPQRFLWLSTTDPAMPDERPAWPGPLGYRSPAKRRTDLRPRPELGLHCEIVAEIDTRALTAVRGLSTETEMDSHRDLLKLKVAGLLCLLDGRQDVELSDWSLAEMVLQASAATRQGIETVLQAEAERVAQAADRQEERRTKVRTKAATDAEAEAYQVALEAAAGAMARRAAKVGLLDLTAANRAMSSRHRRLVTTEQAIEHAVAEGWLTESENGWETGEKSP